MELIKLPTFKNLPTREELLLRIEAIWNPERPTETIPVQAALDRIPARDVLSSVSLPMVRASVRDGIAVDSSRFKEGVPDTSDWVIGRDFVRADTGDDFDDSFDAVIMIEDVDLSTDDRLRIHDGVTVTPKMNTRGPGTTVRVGDPLVKKHMPLRPKDLAGIQMGGYNEVEVLKKPVVAFIPTGSELIPPGTPVTRGKNIDTNSILVRATLHQLGAEPLSFPIVHDEKAALEAALDEALANADVVIINGGSSKGDEDYCARLLHKRGEVLCHGVKAAPGKPLCAAIIQNKPVINLPGPFMAAYHGLEWCINAIVFHYLCLPRRQRERVKATLTREQEASNTVSFLSIMDVEKKKNGEGYWATPSNFKDIPTWRCVQANGQYMTVIGKPVPEGEDLEVELLRGLEFIPLSEN